MWSYISNPQYVIMAWCLDKHRDSLPLSPNINWDIKSRRIKWEVCVKIMVEERNAYKILVGKREVKSARKILNWPLEKNSVNWIHLAQDRAQ
jgi:hypothetical protein